MKKFNLLIALALFAGTIAFSPAIANAQEDKAAQKIEFERNWYDICYTKKDTEKRILSPIERGKYLGINRYTCTYLATECNKSIISETFTVSEQRISIHR